MPLGDRIRDLRVARGMTQERLAADATVSHRTITRVESGASMPNRSTLRLIAAALGVELHDLDERWAS